MLLQPFREKSTKAASSLRNSSFNSYTIGCCCNCCCWQSGFIVLAVQLLLLFVLRKYIHTYVCLYISHCHMWHISLWHYARRIANERHTSTLWCRLMYIGMHVCEYVPLASVQLMHFFLFCLLFAMCNMQLACIAWHLAVFKLFF